MRCSARVFAHRYLDSGKPTVALTAAHFLRYRSEYLHAVFDLLGRGTTQGWSSEGEMAAELAGAMGVQRPVPTLPALLPPFGVLLGLCWC